MANNPISMSKIRQILRLHSQGRSKLLIAGQTGVSRNTLKKYLKEFERSGLSFEEITALSDKDLEDLFVKPEEKPRTSSCKPC
jgi:transposase